MKTSTTEIKRADHRGGEFCSTASMKALGYQPAEDRPKTGYEINAELRRAGFTVAEVGGCWSWQQYGFRSPTLRRLLDDLEPGNYLIATSGHVMSLVDGVLTDTANRTLRRKVRAAYRVEVTR